MKGRNRKWSQIQKKKRRDKFWKKHEEGKYRAKHPHKVVKK